MRESILSEQTESEGTERLAENVKNPDDAAELNKKMDKMIKTKKNNILMIAYQQGKIFKKFKTDNKFINAVTKFKIGTVIFIDESPKTWKSCISLYYLKNNFRVIKKVCQEHASKFQ